MHKLFSYDDYISPKLIAHLQDQLHVIPGVPGLAATQELSGLESRQSMAYLVDVFSEVKPYLRKVLEQRINDRLFIDKRTKAYYEYNQQNNIDLLDPKYKTLLGDEDDLGRIIVGPVRDNYCQQSDEQKVAPIPEYLQGFHVTLFGPPDDAKLSINAMNAYHRKLKDEPAIIAELLAKNTNTPKWGADDEDSKTPMHQDLVAAGVNLKGCLNHDIGFFDEKRNKSYQLADSFLSQPIKRFPGLALPCSFLFYEKEPLPLHLYDFCLHLFEHWNNPKALCFYVPKLENEEEARYIKTMIEVSERLIQKIHPEYKIGTVRIIIVLENPRAVFRVNEMMDELFPYFVGASLGWHDYLGSTARLFKEDGNYRIPVKADPDIVIKYIKASHELLANVVGLRGGIKIGGMYGILPIDNELSSESFQITLRGYFRDVLTQLKRDLSGFWVAHPDFIRIGMAMVKGWELHAAGDSQPLHDLVDGLLNKKYADEIKTFITAPDIDSLDIQDPNYDRALIVADIKESEFIANNDPEEIRYNVFQMLQYLCDWLSGNGCVALPTQIKDVPARVMDDLATAERSRWEVWHEIYHGRFAVEDFIKIAHEEMNFIRRDLSDAKKIVQIKYSDQNAKWYDVAFKLMLKLMTDVKPVEFATELLLPFTLDFVRNSEDPWDKLSSIETQKYKLQDKISRYNYFFELCGSQKFASDNLNNITLDQKEIEKSIQSFSTQDILDAASFHGDIGQKSKSLDSFAKSEQAKVAQDSDVIKNELLMLGEKYKNKFGFKFLISAKDKTSQDIKAALLLRMNNSLEDEINNAKAALLEITLKRVVAKPLNDLKKKIDKIFSKSKVNGAQVTIASGFEQRKTLCLGSANDQHKVDNDSLFQIASLSKTFGSIFAIETLIKKNIALDTPVNFLLAQLKSSLRLQKPDSDWGNEVTLRHLMQHTALNMHYVDGIMPVDFPNCEDLLLNPAKYSYEEIQVLHKPGRVFQYSGAGFIILEYITRLLLADEFDAEAKKFLHSLGTRGLSFTQGIQTQTNLAHGYRLYGEKLESNYLSYPLFAAGMWSTTTDVLIGLEQLAKAYRTLEGAGPISHDTAVNMSFAVDLGAQDFMSAQIGLGVFVVEAGENRFYLHQGANDGFRAIYLYCFDGPNVGIGLCICANGELDAVYLIAELAKTILAEMDIEGVDFSSLPDSFSLQGLCSEEIVNIGYKELLLNAFKQTQPEAIIKVQKKYPLGDLNILKNSELIRVSNEKFARIENLISEFEPSFDPKEFGKQGKIMDSWESARHNQSEFEFARFRLSHPSKVQYVHLSTKYHDGNQVEDIEILGDGMIILPKTKLAPHSFLNIKLNELMGPFKEIEVRAYPDGGLTRLALMATIPQETEVKFQSLENPECKRYKEVIPSVKKPMSIPFEIVGIKLAQVSDEHYAQAANVLSPFNPLNMFDGFETKRSRKKDHFEFFEIEFDKIKEIEKIEFDFSYFKNNAPMWIEIEDIKEDSVLKIDRFFAKPYAGNICRRILEEKISSQKIRIKLVPDGGVNRVRFL